MKIRISSLSDASIAFLGLVLGYVFADGSSFGVNMASVYIGLWTIVVLMFVAGRFHLNSLKIACAVMAASGFVWFVSMSVVPDIEIVIWKSAVGIAWLILVILLTAEAKLAKVEKFCQFLIGFGLSFAILALLNWSDFVGLRLSFRGDTASPHVYASALILTGSALVTMSSVVFHRWKYVMLSLGILLICISILTLSKTSILAIALLLLYVFKNHAFVFSIIVMGMLGAVGFNIVSVPEIDLSRALNFNLSDVSIGGRFELFVNTLLSSLSNFGMPGFIGYPKNWIDTSTGSLISTFGLSLSIVLVLLLCARINKINFASAIIVLLFLTTEHFILPRIFLPLTLLLIAIKYSSACAHSKDGILRGEILARS